MSLCGQRPASRRLWPLLGWLVPLLRLRPAPCGWHPLAWPRGAPLRLLLSLAPTLAPLWARIWPGRAARAGWRVGLWPCQGWHRFGMPCVRGPWPAFGVPRALRSPWPPLGLALLW